MTKKLRSQAWFGGLERDAFIHRSWMKEMEHLLHLEALTVTGKSVGENIRYARCYNREVIAPFNEPFQPHGGIAVLRGNLAPNGAVLKPSAASPALMRHRGRAVVFETIEDFKTRQPPRAPMAGGYQRLYVDHVMQADQGADFDVLLGCRGCAAPQRESH
jgi:hypothetical protein